MSRIRYYAVTHVDAQRVRRRLVIGAPNNVQAREFALRAYGPAWYIGAVRQEARA